MTTQLDQQQVYDTACTGAWMLADLGASYRAGTPLVSVGEFQALWNALLPSVINLPGIYLPSDPGDGSLVVDSLYGANTAIAVRNFIAANPPPDRAADMPAWFGVEANYEAVFAMCPMEDEPELPAPPVPEPVIEETTTPEVIVPATIPATDTTIDIAPSVTPLPSLTVPAPSTPGGATLAAIGLGVVGLVALGYYATRK